MKIKKVIKYLAFPMKNTARKQEIITVASNLFKEKGYSAVTMRDIAKEMGIKAARIYKPIKNIRYKLMLPRKESELEKFIAGFFDEVSLRITHFYIIGLKTT